MSGLAASRMAGSAATNALAWSRSRTSGGARRSTSGCDVVDQEAGALRGGGDRSRQRRRSARCRAAGRSPRTSVTNGWCRLSMPCGEVLAQGRDVVEQTVLGDGAQHRECRRRRRSGCRRTWCRAGQAATVPQRRRRRCTAPIGRPPPRPLARVITSGRDARLLEGEPAAECGRCRSAPRRAPAAHRRCGDVAGGLQVAVRRGHHTTLAEDGLEEHGGRLAVHCGLQRRGVAERNVRHAGQQRLERRALRLLAGERKRAHGAAVEGAVSRRRSSCGRSAG